MTAQRRISAPADDGLTLTVRSDPGGALLTLAGRLDALVVATVREAITEQLSAGKRCLAFDLTDVEFIDSAGLAALIQARRECHLRGGQLALIAPASEAAMRIFRLTQFDQVFLMIGPRLPG